MTKFILTIFFVFLIFVNGELEAQDISYDLIDFQQFVEFSDIAVLEDKLYLLADYHLYRADLFQQGKELQVEKVGTTENNYNHLQIVENNIYCFNNDGSYAVYISLNDHIELLAESIYVDSLFAISGFSDLRYFANGYSGLSLLFQYIDGSLGNYETINKGVHYTDFLISGDKFFAVDDFNGIEIYTIGNRYIAYQTTVLTDYPVTDFAVYENMIFICYDNHILSKFIKSENEYQEEQIIFDKSITGLTSLSSGLLLNQESGLLSIYDPFAKQLLDSFQVRSSVQKLISSQFVNKELIVSLDNFGNVDVLEFAEQKIKYLNNWLTKAVPICYASYQDQLFISRTDGLFLYSPQSDLNKLTGSSLHYTAMSVTDSIFVAYSAITQALHIYLINDLSLDEIMKIDLDFNPEDIQLDLSYESEFEILLVGNSKIEAWKCDLEQGNYESLYQLETYGSIASAGGSITDFWLVEDNGYFQDYRWDGQSNRPVLDYSDQLNSNLANMKSITDSRYIFANESGINFYIYNQSIEKRFEHTLSSDLTSSDIVIDPISKLAFFATGEGVYSFELDKLVYSDELNKIAGISDVSKLMLTENYLFAISDIGIFTYARIENAIQTITNDPFIVSEVFPNPFNGEAAVEIDLANISAPITSINYQIYNVLGQTVFSAQIPVNRTKMRIAWDGRQNLGSSAASGVYLLRVYVNSQSVIRKMLYLR